ncbi:MAG: AAA family ATPase [Caldilineaceae bacterium]
MLKITPGETLRVLLVAEQEVVRAGVEEALQEWAGNHQLFWVAQAELAGARAQDLQPHAILVDDELGGAELTEVIRRLVAQAPGAVVLALLQEYAIGEASQAVLAGARGFVTKPFSSEQFWNTLRQLLAQPRTGGQAPTSAPQRAGRTVVFAAPKGGTGRTTMTVNTAISLHQSTGQSVVLVDADFAAPALDVMLNLHDEHDLTDLLARLSKVDEDLIRRVLTPHSSGVQVLLAPPPAQMSAPLTLPQVQQVVSLLRRMFDWVIVDLGLPFDEMAFAFLDTADRIVVSVLPEMVGLRNTRLLLDTLQGRGYSGDKIWLVLNRATLKGGVAQREIENRLRLRIRHTIPDDQPLASYTVNRGVPLALSHKRSAVARATLGLATLLAADAQAGRAAAESPESGAPSLGFLARLFGRPSAADA